MHLNPMSGNSTVIHSFHKTIFFSHYDPRSTVTVSLESRNSLNPMWLTTEGQCIYGGWLMSLKITYVVELFGVLIVFYDDDGEDHQHEDCRTH